MSAILEALKKLEQEASEPSGHPLRREIKRHGEWRRIPLAGMLAVGVVLCGLAGYGVVVLTRKTPVAPVSITDRQAVKSSPAAAVSPAPGPSPANRPGTASQPYQVTASAKPLGFMIEQETPAPAEKIVAVALEPEEMSGETSEEAVPPDAALPGEAYPEEGLSSADPPEANLVSNVPIGIFNDPEVVLQAISWSPDVSRRMAVINGKICRESEQINGYVIKQVNPEDVVVSKGSVTGRLVFKIR
ncbi:MAG: hypothetical protein WA081_15745 [Desulfosalsimonadaceae bacterium]